MKIFIYADPHWSQYSSILRQRGERYSKRLENLIDSVNWVERTAEEQECSKIVCLGDFFDKAELNAEELTALSEVKWSKKCTHVFLVGNHEIAIADNSISSAHILKLLPNSYVIHNFISVKEGKVVFTYLPYILEDKREPLSAYVEYNDNDDGYNVVLSHNDLQIQYGMYKSSTGFTIEEVEGNCNIFFNGHLHNKEVINDKIVNIGNLTGQNFSEDASKYSHGAVIFDTDTLEYVYMENPYAINFYKFSYNDHPRQLKSNSVISLSVSLSQKSEAEQYIKDNTSIIASRIVVQAEKQTTPDNTPKIEAPNHIEQFIAYVTQTLGSDDIIVNELKEVCK